MKKYILTTALIAISYFGFAQLSPSGQFRIADRGTAFGINLPVGSQIFVSIDSSLWDVIAPITGLAATINNSQASLDQVNRDKYINNEGLLKVLDTPNGAKITSNTVGSDSVMFRGGTGIHITRSGMSITVSDTSNSTSFVQTWEEGTTGSSGTATVLTHTPIGGLTALTVQLNGMPLKSTEFTLTGTPLKTVTVGIPVYQFDRITVSYTY